MSELEKAARAWATACKRERAARDALRAAVVAEKAAVGTPDAELARRAGVDRMTVLEWLGKRSRKKPQTVDTPTIVE